jgi:hypothetical protein
VAECVVHVLGNVVAKNHLAKATIGSGDQKEKELKLENVSLEITTHCGVHFSGQDCRGMFNENICGTIFRHLIQTCKYKSHSLVLLIRHFAQRCCF